MSTINFEIVLIQSKMQSVLATPMKIMKLPQGRKGQKVTDAHMTDKNVFKPIKHLLTGRFPSWISFARQSLRNKKKRAEVSENTKGQKVNDGHMTDKYIFKLI